MWPDHTGMGDSVRLDGHGTIEIQPPGGNDQAGRSDPKDLASKTGESESKNSLSLRPPFRADHLQPSQPGRCLLLLLRRLFIQGALPTLPRTVIHFCALFLGF